MPSESLKQVFATLVDNVYETFEVDQEFTQTETDLICRENELKQYAKKD
eukprot:CAMPEP_0176341700 /NCGR_PEP_ID=MMETSP0126-20121128/2588_1 /TAXON_ID=141414 ORGANISM="Strombidinopsis acuminatum, Strain SPMC142" /NCGR_SAMPLE_ID=MMETSP0126 /ASSEMBLY_ACC=CAM_ASM_000229 /LENGTH=48 /DNA_ID= /DNA_START= /DNA_END= /DNA_ORIENTATION=